MRIALIIERLDVSRGGRERSTAEIAAELARRGQQVEVLCAEGNLVAEGVTVVSVGGRGLTRAGRLRSFVAAAQRRLAEQRYDVSHAMLPLPGAAVYQLRGGTLPALRQARLRMCRGWKRVAARLTWPGNRARACLAALERQVVADPNVWCLPVSQMVAEELMEEYGRVENVRVIYNAVSAPVVSAEQHRQWRTDIRRRWGVGEDAFVLFSASMNFELKAGPEMCRAFARFRADHPGLPVALVIAGDRVGGLAGQGVIAHGRVDDIWPLYAAADAVVLLSWYDPCSRVVLEAVSMGTPCLTTEYNGAAEVLAEGAGLVVDDPADVSAVAAAYARLADPAERARHAESCRAVAPRLSMRRHVDQLLAVYEEIARR